MKEGCDLCKRMRVIVLRTGVRVDGWMVGLRPAQLEDEMMEEC